MYLFLTIIILLASVLLVLVVLVQNSKGGGLASGFSSSNQIMGVRKTTDFLEKATWTLAITMVLLCIVSVAFLPKGVSVEQSAIKQQVEQATKVDPNLAAPAFGNETPAAEAPEQTPAQ